MVRYKHQEVTKGIIGAFYNVYNRLGYGFLERVYENSMVIELNEIGLLLNFGPLPTKKRKIFDNNKKPNLQTN